MSDIFQEVDEEVRREQLQKLWERYQNYVIAGVILIVLGVAAWRGYDWWETKRATESGAAFETAIQLAEEGKHADAEAAFAKVAAEGTTGYRTLARIRQAAELAERAPQEALAAYLAIAADSSVGAAMQDLAALRAGALQIDAGANADAKTTLERLTAEGRPFRHSARELLVLAAWRAGDTVAARRWSDVVMTDAQTPPATRARVEMLIALITAESTG